MSHARTGERYGGEFRLSQQEILEFARLNPIHHDAEVARKTRFGRIVASGPQPASFYMALGAVPTNTPYSVFCYAEYTTAHCVRHNGGKRDHCNAFLQNHCHAGVGVHPRVSKTCILGRALSDGVGGDGG